MFWRSAGSPDRGNHRPEAPDGHIVRFLTLTLGSAAGRSLFFFRWLASRRPWAMLDCQNNEHEAPRSRWIDENSVLEAPRSRWIGENIVLEGPRSRWIDENSVLEVPRSRWIDKNSSLEAPRSRWIEKNSGLEDPCRGYGTLRRGEQHLSGTPQKHHFLYDSHSEN